MYTDGMLVDPTVGVMRDNLMRTCKDHHNCVTLMLIIQRDVQSIRHGEINEPTQSISIKRTHSNRNTRRNGKFLLTRTFLLGNHKQYYFKKKTIVHFI